MHHIAEALAYLFADVFPDNWYFTDRYPTPSGTRLVNHAFVNYIDKSR